MQLTRRSFIGSTAGGLPIGSPTLAQTLAGALPRPAFASSRHARPLCGCPAAIDLRARSAAMMERFPAQFPSRFMCQARRSSPAVASLLFKMAPAAPIALELINPTELSAAGEDWRQRPYQRQHFGGGKILWPKFRVGGPDAFQGACAAASASGGLVASISIFEPKRCHSGVPGAPSSARLASIA